MIENFDHLVERCNAKRRKRMFRISFLISGTIVIFIAITAITMQWLNSSKNAAQHISHTANATVTKVISQPVNVDANVSSTLIKSSVPLSAESCLPLKDPSKPRSFVVQLTSSKSFDEVNASRRRIPEKYYSSLAIYYINDFYTLRYIDIYERSSLPQMIQYFRSIGFPSTTAYKYNPDRVAITAPLTAAMQSTMTAKTTPVPKDVPVPVTLPATPPHSTVVKDSSSNRLFNVQTLPAGNTTQDFINAYNRNPKYETALKIAQDCYTKNNYLDAAIWAKKANQLNREAEEAWLLYAKSYYAQGRKIDAIEILELYLHYKDSKAASELIRTWKSTPAN